MFSANVKRKKQTEQAHRRKKAAFFRSFRQCWRLQMSITPTYHHILDFLFSDYFAMNISLSLDNVRVLSYFCTRKSIV